MNLGKKLKQLRLSKKLNQSDLAKMLNIDRSTYGKYETGDSSPDYDKLIKLANFYRVTIDYLLGRTNDTNVYAYSENGCQKQTDARESEAKYMTEELSALEKLAAPIVEWIREHHGPHTEVHISWDHVWVRQDLLGLPFPYSEE